MGSTRNNMARRSTTMVRGIPEPTVPGDAPKPTFPGWLCKLLSQNKKDLKLQAFTHPLDIPSKIRGQYLTALKAHAGCKFCSGTHIKNGFTYCAELEDKLVQAREKVSYSFNFSNTTRFTSRRYAIIVARPLVQLNLSPRNCQGRWYIEVQVTR